MNHQQDIDDGLDEFTEDRERQEAERGFKRQPGPFARDIKGLPFAPEKVDELILIGDRTEEHGSPFDFESGYAVVRGRWMGSAVTLVLRWEQNGREVQSFFRT